jgi:carbonic anhydrase/acetyltransferase-like protein (isoleucine patch superfamily)
LTNIRPFHGFTPLVSARAYVDPAAHVIGNVSLGEDSSVWPCAVVRGDAHAIRIGARSNVQDGAQLHVTHDAQYTLGGFALTLGDDVTIGHGAVLHGCTVQEAALIGMHATILDGALIKKHSVVGAGAVVTHGKVVGSGELWLGNPARCVRMLSGEEIQKILYTARQYVKLSAQYRDVRAAPIAPPARELERRMSGA